MPPHATIASPREQAAESLRIEIGSAFPWTRNAFPRSAARMQSAAFPAVPRSRERRSTPMPWRTRWKKSSTLRARWLMQIPTRQPISCKTAWCSAPNGGELLYATGSLSRRALRRARATRSSAVATVAEACSSAGHTRAMEDGSFPGRDEEKCNDLPEKGDRPGKVSGKQATPYVASPLAPSGMKR